MEANRPPSTKWVSRRTLDSQASSRESKVGLSHPRGSNSDHNPNSANHHHNAEKRKYGHAPDAVMTAIGRGSGGVGGAAASGNSPPAPFHTNGSGNSRYGISGSGNSSGWGGNAPNSNTNNNKLSHQGNVFSTNSVNPHGPHGTGNNNGNGGGRRGYGGGGSYGEGMEPTIPPPPRSVQMGQGTLSAQAAAATSRDFIPQPRHAKANSSGSSHSLKSTEASPPSPPPGAGASCNSQRQFDPSASLGCQRYPDPAQRERRGSDSKRTDTGLCHRRPRRRTNRTPRSQPGHSVSARERSRRCWARGKFRCASTSAFHGCTAGVP
ncbi:hypothetical protein LSCM4_06408 [Leishmania orientalis]|uniref:Uncharacterized protein n=1 Tax=Leishmania orientalis TaxID=2249476 RepID=A0A836HB10_9TRYP|nr:hypothetical protein LSCM4_06408 [Leishmania orientalis]